MLELKDTNDFLKCVRNELVPKNKKTSNGLIGLLEYRLNENVNHPDNMYDSYNEKLKRYEGGSITAKLFKKIYGCVEESSDTIFNCWNYFSMFARGKLDVFYISPQRAIDRLDDIFKGDDELRILFDKFADLHHSMANFMPAPRGYNGYSFKNYTHDGKGNYDRDNDFPDIYYKRAENDFPYIYSWINKNKKKYSLEFFEEYKSPWKDGIANNPLNIKEKEELECFIKSIKDAITCLETRAKNLNSFTNSNLSIKLNE